jgi:hypothetical protein
MPRSEPPLRHALSAVTAALARYGVVPVRHSPSGALHRLQYDRAGATVAAVGWGDTLLMVTGRLPADLAALIAAHARLACVHPDKPRNRPPTPSSRGVRRT